MKSAKKIRTCSLRGKRGEERESEKDIKGVDIKEQIVNRGG